jgi:hypothetical protein
MKIHLSRPGGQREGPFTIEQINADLAAKKYHDTDYWAWHEGLTNWVPLHSVPGITRGSDAVSPACDVRESAQSAEISEAGGTAVLTQVASSPTAVASEPETDAEPNEERSELSAREPDSEEEPATPSPELSSGMTFAALEQIFMLTTGEGQAASRSAVTAGMLEEVTGQGLTTIRENVPRHVMVHCGFLEKLRGGGPLPEEAWRALAKVNSELVRQAREGLFRVCVRSFPLETGDMTSLFLFYNKQKL